MFNGRKAGSGMSPEPAQPNLPAREYRGVQVPEYQVEIAREFFGDHFDDGLCVQAMLSYAAYQMARDLIARRRETEDPEAVDE